VARTGPRKAVDPAFWAGRLANARAYRDAAHQAALLAEPGQNANPIVSHLVSAAIGYADALTAKYGGTVNQQDHAAVVKAVRAALGNRVPEAALKQLGRILREKDAAQYGARFGRLDHARELLADLDELAEWAEQELGRR
jgi:hypothetical protein